MTDEELEAFNGLMEGNLNGLADLLSLGLDAMHPHLQQRLLMMIDAWQGADYGLEVKCLKNHNLTLGYRRAKRQLKHQLVDRMIELGAERRGYLKRAAEQAIKEEKFQQFASVETAVRYYHAVRKARARLERFNRAHINRAKSEK